MKNNHISYKKDFLLYTKTARTYDSRRFSGQAGKWGHQRQITILENLTKDWKGKEVLEIGCGTGRITEAIARWGAEVTATDISEEMLEVAKSRFRKYKSPSTPRFRVMSIFDIDMNLKGYDYIIMVNVLGHLSKPSEVVQEISSKMSKTCRFIFTFPCLTSILLPFGLLVNARGKSLLHDVTSHWYTPSRIEKYCNEAGLEIVGWQGNHYVPLPRLLFPTFPLFVVCEALLAKSFPKRCPSVFVECGLQPSDEKEIR